MEIKKIPVSQIVVDRDLLPRVDLDEETLRRYREVPIEDFPPIIVFQIGDKCKLASGLHRLDRQVHEGLTEIEAEVRFGSDGDLIQVACEGNAKHGLPLSREQRRRAIGLLLANPEQGRKSDAALAEIAGCSDKTVATARTELSESAGDGTLGNSGPEARVGRDGKKYPVPSRNPKPRGKDAAIKESEPAQESDEDVDPHCVKALEAQTEFDALLGHIRAAEGSTRRLGKDLAQARTFAPRPMLKLFGAAKAMATALRPAGHCPECMGSGCGNCEQLGWLLPILKGSEKVSDLQEAVLKRVGIEVKSMGKERATRIIDTLRISGDFKPRPVPKQIADLTAGIEGLIRSVDCSVIGTADRRKRAIDDLNGCLKRVRQSIQFLGGKPAVRTPETGQGDGAEGWPEGVKVAG